MRQIICLASGLALLSLAGATDVAAQTCPGNPNAIGTSRVLPVNPVKLRRIGKLQYSETLPLADREIVLSFDDGPVIPSTERVLDVLASECVKATFFLLGQNAKDSPDIARRIAREGHTIGSHTESHAHLGDLDVDTATAEIEMGMASIKQALGKEGTLAPFFRAPYLELSPELNVWLRSKDMMLWSVDFQADDWLNLPSDEVLRRAVSRIESTKRGVLLLHDIHSRTADMLPKLLDELKRRNFKIVHVVSETPPGGAGNAATR